MWTGLGFGLNLIWAKLNWAWLYGLGLAMWTGFGYTNIKSKKEP